MSSPVVPSRRLFAFAGACVLLAALAAGPVLGVDPSPSVEPAASPDRIQMPEKPPKPDQAAKPDKAQKVKVPTAPIAVTGTVERGTDAEGDVRYSLTAGGRTYELGAGPHWYWGDDHPLADKVGERVDVTGEIAEGSDEIDVETVDGQALREPGRPPWAGGPKAVGERHPGWKAWHAAHPDGKPGKGQANGQGRATAPGQLKKADPTPAP